MACKHCCINASSQNFYNEFISSDQDLIKQRIDEMVSFGFKEFYISGGEPFLVKEILNLLNYLREKNMVISVASNGYFLNELLIKKLSKINLNLLHLSLDGHSARIHNSLRGGNFFNKVVNNLNLLIKYKIPVRIGCIIWQENKNFLEEMIKFCIDLKVKELRFSWLIKVGRLKNNSRLYPKRRYFSVIREIEKLEEKYKNKIKISVHRALSIVGNDICSTCPGGDTLFHLNYEGKFSPCSWIAKIDQNFLTKKSLKETKLQDLFKSKEILEFRRIIKEREKKNFKGCPFMAKYQNNSYYSNDNLINL